MISPWYGNRAAAVSLRFDDNLKSHLEIAIPIMNRFGIRGTFMVSPGRRSFLKYRDRWLREVPAMGHELGNHTMSHKGARSVAEAKYEIGEAAGILRQGTGDPDRILLFASGGGKRWGGRRWSEADKAYHEVFDSYNMIDLYDGHHPYINVVNGLSPEELIGHVEAAAREGRYQAFTFHSVGPPTLRDIVRRLIRGIDLSYPEEDFRQFMKMLHDRSDRVWIAPIGDILKYKAEYESSHIEDVQYLDDGISLELTVGTDPVFYDHPLTMVLPRPDNGGISVLQDGKKVDEKPDSGDRACFDLQPVTSSIQIRNVKLPSSARIQ